MSGILIYGVTGLLEGRPAKKFCLENNPQKEG
jgi:hypothetical protein